MPGPFSPILAPISPATTGQMGPNIGAELAQAAATFPAQQQEAEQRRLALAQTKLAQTATKLQNEKQQQAIGLQKLGLYYRMALTDPTKSKLRDPNFLAAVDSATKDAGLPSLVTTDPATGEKVLDLSAFQHVVASKLLTDLSPEQQMAIAQAQPGEPRSGLLEQFGVNPATVPEAAINHPAYMSTAQRDSFLNNLGSQISMLSKGDLSIQGILGILQLKSGELANAGVSVDDLRNYLTSPAFTVGVLGPAIQAKLEQLRTLGIKDAALSAWYKQKTEDEPKDLASKIQYRNGSLVIRQEKLTLDKQLGYAKLGEQARANDIKAQQVKAYTANVQNNINTLGFKKSLVPLQIAVKTLVPQLQALEKQHEQLVKQAGDYILSSPSHDIPSDLQRQMSDVQQAITAAQAALQTANNAAGGHLDNLLTQGSGKATTVSDPNAPPFAGAIRVQNGGKYGWKYPDGSIHTDDGQIIPPSKQ